MAALQEFLHAAEEVDSVVDADARAERDHGQRIDLEADADECHDGVDEDRDQRERNDHHDRAGHGPEVHEAHDRHGGEHPAEDHELLGLHFLVLRGHHADVARCKPVGNAFRRILRPVFLDRRDHALEGLGAMVRQEQHHRHHAAVAVQEPGARLDVVLGLHELALVPRQVPPLEAALAPPRAHDL